MLRTIALLALTVLVAACTPPSPDDELRDLGSYKLGHNIVVAPKVQMVPGSRPVEAQEWVDLLTNEVSARFSQYEGDQLYHFGISVEGYFVAPGGVPLVLSPKSVLAVNVTVWDDAANKKLNTEPKTFTVFETTSGESFLVGSAMPAHVKSRCRVWPAMRSGPSRPGWLNSIRKTAGLMRVRRMWLRTPPTRPADSAFVKNEPLDFCAQTK